MLEIFWSPRFWFGETNISWNDFVHANTSTYELMYPIIAGLILLISRDTISSYIIKVLEPFRGKSLNSRNSSKNRTLERIFNSHKTSKNIEQMIKAITQSGITQREAERWLRNRLKEDTKNQKLTDTSMRAAYYIFMFIYGISIMYEKPWL